MQSLEPIDDIFWGKVLKVRDKPIKQVCHMYKGHEIPMCIGAAVYGKEGCTCKDKSPLTVTPVGGSLSKKALIKHKREITAKNRVRPLNKDKYK